MKGYIYRVINTANWKTYIGQTTREPEVRWKAHIADSRKGGNCHKFCRAIRKYGEEMFSFEVIAEVVRNTEEELFDVLDSLEKEYIKYYDSINNGYNIIEGGGGHRKNDSWYIELNDYEDLEEVWKGTENNSALQYASAYRNGRIENKNKCPKYINVKDLEEYYIIPDIDLWY